MIFLSIGAHLNPAVSFGLFLIGKLKFFQLWIYMMAQFLGAFIGALLVFILYYDALNKYENEKSLDTAKIFTTFPNDNISFLTTLFDQILGTGYLVMVIFALGEKKISNFSHGLVSLMNGLAIFVISSTMGYNCGSPINPARDFSPRFFIYISGWGGQVFTQNSFYFLIPIFGPILGAFFAAIIYTILIANNLD